MTRGNATPGDLDQLKDRIPELRNLPYEVVYEEFFPSGGPIDSTNVSIDLCNRLADRIAECHDHYDGVVVAFGTNTMASSAATIAYELSGLKKPVVFTGSMHEQDVEPYDGARNLTDAIHFAARSGYDVPLIPEVVIGFCGKILRAVRAQKIRSHDPDAFETPGLDPLAEISEQGATIKINESLLLRPMEARQMEVHQVRTDLKILPIDMIEGFADFDQVEDL